MADVCCQSTSPLNESNSIIHSPSFELSEPGEPSYRRKFRSHQKLKVSTDGAVASQFGWGSFLQKRLNLRSRWQGRDDTNFLRR